MILMRRYYFEDQSSFRVACMIHPPDFYASVEGGGSGESLLPSGQVTSPSCGVKPPLLFASDFGGDAEFSGLQAGAQREAVGQKLDVKAVDQRP